MKSILKVIYNVQTIDKYFKDEITLWVKAKWLMARGIRNLSIVASFVFVGYISAISYSSLHPKTVYADRETDISDQILTARIEILKQSVVNDVSKCENPAQNEGLIIFDSNKKASMGLLMFQTETVKWYEKSLNGKTLSDKEANQLALDGVKSKELAEQVMFTTKNKASMDWVTCARKANADLRIDMIKQLEGTK